MLMLAAWGCEDASFENDVPDGEENEIENGDQVPGDGDSSGVCTFEGEDYQNGDVRDLPPCDACENYCACLDGEWACSDCDCSVDETCIYDGKEYALGETFDAVDGCNTCECKIDPEGSTARVACTEEPCEESETCFNNSSRVNNAV